MRLRLSNIPELQPFDDEDRQRVIDACFHHAGQVPATRIVWWVLNPVALMSGLATALFSRSWSSVPIALLLAAATAMLLGVVAVMQDRSVIRQQLGRLQGGRALTCPACNYDLRGSPGDHCPECGSSVYIDKFGRVVPPSGRPDTSATDGHG